VSERERTDGVAPRAVAVTQRAFEHENGHEGRACGHSAAEQPACP
jgi:hypothetical protein